MARKDIALLHIGPTPSGDEHLHQSLGAHADLLATVDLLIPEIDPRLLQLAEHEMLRDHKAAGLSRKEVEGSWAKVCRKATKQAAKAKGDVVLCSRRFHEATDEQVQLILQGLGGFDVHVVITPVERHVEADTPEIAATWGRHLDSDRVLVAPLADDAAMIDLAENLVGEALCLRKNVLDRRIAKLKKRRKVLRRRIELRDAS